MFFWNTHKCWCCLLCRLHRACLPQICLPRHSQADRVAILSEIFQWIPIFHRTKSRILNQHSKSLRIWTLRHLPPFLALPRHSSSTKLPWFPERGILFLLLLPVSGPAAYSFGWGSTSSKVFSWTSGVLHFCSSPTGTRSHAHCTETLSVMPTSLIDREGLSSFSSPSLLGAAQRGVW